MGFIKDEIIIDFSHIARISGQLAIAASVAESREAESAGGPNMPRVPRDAALSHHTRTDINTWPRAIYAV